MKPLTFFRRSIRKFAETQRLFNKIDSTTYELLRSWSTGREAKDYAERLFRDRVIKVPEFNLFLHLKALREMDGREFNQIEVVLGRIRQRRGRKCFVGHRFSPSVEKTLRWNLQQVLEPYCIQLDWSGRDMASVQILDDIVRKIKRADFCIFDNRGTKGRPNVYIEAGMCIALKKPFVLLEYMSGRGILMTLSPFLRTSASPYRFVTATMSSFFKISTSASPFSLKKTFDDSGKQRTGCRRVRHNDYRYYPTRLRLRIVNYTASE